MLQIHQLIIVKIKTKAENIHKKTPVYFCKNPIYNLVELKKVYSETSRVQAKKFNTKTDKYKSITSDTINIKSP